MDKIEEDVQLETLKKVEPKIFIYKQVGNTSLKYYAFKPIGRPKYCVICIHGGGWTRETPKRLFPHCAYFAKHGALAIAIEYRLIKGDLDVRNCLHDCVDGLAYIRKYLTASGYDIPIVALGDSAGGYLAVCLGTQNILSRIDSNVKKVDYVVDLNGIVDLTGYWGEYLNDENERKNFSPLYNVSKNDAPVLLIHGLKDSVVEPQSSKDYANELMLVGVKNRLIFLPNTEHAFILFEYNQTNQFVFEQLNIIENYLRTELIET